MARALALRSGDREELERWARSDRYGASAAKRARIVLLGAEGVANTRIAELCGPTVTTVLNWRGRYEERGIAGLRYLDRPGRPRVLDHRQIVAATLKEATTEEARRHALVDAVAGGSVKGLEHLDRPRFAGLRDQALEG